jgi:phosphoribosylanthranilate isomerase
MRPFPIPRVKICCIASVDEAWMAIRAGASALGLVGPMPSGPGTLDEDQIAHIARVVPPGVATFMLTCRQDAAAIVEQHRRCRTNVIQLVDRLDSGTYADLRGAMPGIGLVQVVHVTGKESIEEALSLEEQVDAVLLDSGNPNLPIKELGGTGRIHDWAISARLRERLSTPVYLAGGLKPDNIRAAVETVRPFGVDLCSGVRSDGKLDEDKVGAFFANLPREDRP